MDELPRSEGVNDYSFLEEYNQNLLVDKTLKDPKQKEVVENCVPNFDIGTDLESVTIFCIKIMITS